MYTYTCTYTYIIYIYIHFQSIAALVAIYMPLCCEMHSICQSIAEIKMNSHESSTFNRPILKNKQPNRQAVSETVCSVQLIIFFNHLCSFYPQIVVYA